MARGRYLKWLEEDGLLLITAWARDGLTEKQISKNMGICSDTLFEWKNKFSGISEALKKGKEVADIVVENALYKRAIGFEYTETKETQFKDGAGKIFKRVEKTTRQQAPDVTAQIFWLKNRKRLQWCDAQKRDYDAAVLELRERELKLKEF